MTQVTIAAIRKSGTGSPGGNKDFLSNSTQESFDVALTNEEFTFVLAHLKEKHFKKHQFLIHEGQPVDYCYFVAL